MNSYHSNSVARIAALLGVEPAKIQQLADACPPHTTVEALFGACVIMVSNPKMNLFDELVDGLYAMQAKPRTKPWKPWKPWKRRTWWDR